MIENERVALLSKERYLYTSEERSERTGGHLWTERVVETEHGRVRLLTAIDRQPVPAARERQERDRLRSLAADPSAFERREAAQHSDEEHARHMLEQLPVNFVFDHVRLQDGVWQMDFHPNPAVSPSGIEDRVLHAMSGWIAIDARELRLVHIEGSLPQDFEIGFGLLANIHAGSSFSSDRKLYGAHWRTLHVATDIRGKAALFKTVSRHSEVTRSEFRYLEGDPTVAQAADMLLSDPSGPAVAALGR